MVDDQSRDGFVPSAEEPGAAVHRVPGSRATEVRNYSSCQRMREIAATVLIPYDSLGLERVSTAMV